MALTWLVKRKIKIMQVSNFSIYPQDFSIHELARSGWKWAKGGVEEDGGVELF